MAAAQKNGQLRDLHESPLLSEHSGVFEVAPTHSDLREPSELTWRELLQEDLATYDHKLTEPGLWAVLAHRLGKRSEQASSRSERLLLSSCHRVLASAVSLTWGIDLPKEVQLGRRVRIWHFGCMRLQARSIGNDVHIRHDTTLGPMRMRPGDDAQLPVIEDRADLGVGVCILGDVRVGHDTLVGANTLVLKNVPPSSTVLGVPARTLPR